MHNYVGLVFKVLGISIILMLILDMFYIVGDTLSVNNRVESTALVMQDELSRNNSIPNSIKPLFERQLNDIKSNSNVVKEVRTNMSNNLTIGGVNYPSVSESNIKDYGELLTLVIVVEMEPKSLLFRKQANSEGSFLERNVLSYTRTYKYQVPALRYLK